MVVSILPADMHHVVARACVDQGTHMVTASYLNEKIKQLHQAALEKGVTILNEVGLDPGIDHLLALEAIQEIKALGGKITSFESFCGGLPAPEFSDNPLRYKFSWSPRGALLNTISSAKYLENGEIVTVAEGGELMSTTKPLRFLPGFNLEGFPNRDSTIYAKYYEIEDATTVLRGTLRYSGFTKAVRVLQLLGLLDQEPHPCLHRQGPEISWRFLICNLLGLNDDNIFYDNLKSKIVERTGCDFTVEILEELGLLDNSGVVKCGTPLDTLTYYLSNKLALGIFNSQIEIYIKFNDRILLTGKDERDLIILRHTLGVTWPDNKKEIKGINLVVYGDATYSAMAKTVGYPAAIAAKMILDGITFKINLNTSFMFFFV